MEKETSRERLRQELGWIDERLIKGLGRIYYLCLINKGIQHGYEIKQHVEERFDLNLSDSGIYPILKELEEDGYIESSWSDDGYPRRKIYTLTPQGEKLADESKNHIQELIDTLFED